MDTDKGEVHTSEVKSAAALLDRVKGYPERETDKVQPWKEWFSVEPESDKPTVVLIPSKHDFGSVNLGGF
ncbi:hypothetical protein CMQ_7001 [Grosmannia clavigera kw1407]|uniref:Uncharacterized protein n=1 Tax=Grosmannia clavigera (strain kw1407 / UAMH 11150) TaxID=655863 RepID=F0X7K1_GROCL|nr:uncharacterized protein CMQ_7001 [Grosmannia clavigera kw1407]EFX06680.1 hypothetical protein CMQ_7001 [Grosmannia clavigera kw1407]